MTLAARVGFSPLSDGPAPERPSTEACVVCGWHALVPAADTAHSPGRFVCTVCSAHHVTDI